MIDPNMAVVAVAMMGLTIAAIRLERRIATLADVVNKLDRSHRIAARRA